MANRAVSNKNLKPFTKGDVRINRKGHNGNQELRWDRLIDKALNFRTPAKLRAKILKDTGQDAITYEQAVLATLVANAARGSARHIEMVFKPRGDFARAEAEARRKVERGEGEDDNGSTLLIKVVRRSEEFTPIVPDILPESPPDAT